MYANERFLRYHDHEALGIVLKCQSALYLNVRTKWCPAENMGNSKTHTKKPGDETPTQNLQSGCFR